jgi:hypothetical protein
MSTYSGIFDESDLYKRPPDFAQNTVFQGRKAERRNFVTAGINIGAGRSYPYPIDEGGEGVLLSFTVAVNDENMVVDCYIYDEEGRENPLNDRSMLGVAMLGRGMTVGQAHAVDDSGTSLDMPGVMNTSYPWLSRYKFTPTGTEIDYTTYRGSIDDRWIVLTYTPVVKEQYSRLFFNVRNENTTGDRMIHHMSIQRIKFVDLTSSPVDEDLTTHELTADVLTGSTTNNTIGV